MAESILGVIFRTMFVEFAKLIAWIVIIAALALFLILVLLFVFSGANIAVLLKKNKKKGIVLLLLFIASVLFAFDKNFFPIILLSIYFIISLCIEIVKKLSKYIKKKIKKN